MAGVKALRDDDAEVFEAILRRLVGLTGTDENVVTVAVATRTKGSKQIVPIIPALALVEATRGDHGKLVGSFANIRGFWVSIDPGVAGVQTIEDARAAVLDENNPH